MHRAVSRWSRRLSHLQLYWNPQNLKKAAEEQSSGLEKQQKSESFSVTTHCRRLGINAGE